MKKITLVAMVFFFALALPLSAVADAGKGKGEEKGGCRDEIHKLCPDLKHGDGKMHECIEKNESSLSPACREKVKEKMEHAKKGHKACKDDAERLCKGVEQGEGRIVHCLREHESSLSNDCKESMQHERKHHPCSEDMERLCKDKSGGEGAGHCLREHESSLSPACKEAMQKRKEHMEGQGHGEGKGHGPDKSNKERK